MSNLRKCVPTHLGPDDEHTLLNSFTRSLGSSFFLITTVVSGGVVFEGELRILTVDACTRDITRVIEMVLCGNGGLLKAHLLVICLILGTNTFTAFMRCNLRLQKKRNLPFTYQGLNWHWSKIISICYIGDLITKLHKFTLPI